MEAYGWSLFAYPLFEAQLEKLANAVGKLSTDDPSRRDSHPATKLLVTIKHLVPDVIPRNPNSSEYRQGNTMGPDNRHWFRAKFHGRYRLFFRFSTQQKIIVYAWVNDDASLRKAGSKTDLIGYSKRCLRAAIRQPHFPISWELQRSSRRANRGRRTEAEA